MEKLSGLEGFPDTPIVTALQSIADKEEVILQEAVSGIKPALSP